METEEFGVQEIDERLMEGWFLYGPIVFSPEGAMKQCMVRRLKGHGIYKKMEEIARNKPSNLAGVRNLFNKILELMGRAVSIKFREEGHDQADPFDLYDDDDGSTEYEDEIDDQPEPTGPTDAAEAAVTTEKADTSATAVTTDKAEAIHAVNEQSENGNRSSEVVQPESPDKNKTPVAPTEVALSNKIDDLVVHSTYGSPFEFITPADTSKWKGLLNLRRLLTLIFRPILYCIALIAKLGVRGSYLVAKMVYALKLFNSMMQFNEKEHWEDMDVILKRIDTMATINGFLIDLPKDIQLQIQNYFATTAESRKRLNLILQRKPATQPATQPATPP
jgi:hypothetical protein